MANVGRWVVLLSDFYTYGLFLLAWESSVDFSSLPTWLHIKTADKFKNIECEASLWQFRQSVYLSFLIQFLHDSDWVSLEMSLEKSLF